MLFGKKGIESSPKAGMITGLGLRKRDERCL